MHDSKVYEFTFLHVSELYEFTFMHFSKGYEFTFMQVSELYEFTFMHVSELYEFTFMHVSSVSFFLRYGCIVSEETNVMTRKMNAILNTRGLLGLNSILVVIFEHHKQLL